MKLKINGNTYETNADGSTPLLWVIREHLKLTGTKFGCLKGLCGACSVLIEGKVYRSCITPVNKALGKEITTIEGIPKDHPVKLAWKEVGVPQCGFCQSGQIINAYALLKANPTPTREEIISAMNGNLCRCGTYPRILKAVKRASELMR